MKVSDLVKSSTGTKYHGQVGIIVDSKPRWPNEPRENEMLFVVLYPCGQQLTWSEYDLENVYEISC